MRCGAKPVLVDCDDNHLIDVEHCEKKIGQNTKAIMAVDLFGQMPQMGKLEKIASSAGIVLVEDAAQAQGASHRGRPAGSYGSIAGTSFYPGKNLGAYGDAGAITTDDGELANRARRLRNYGSEVKYHHPEVGFNSRLDTLQAVVLGAKLKHLTMWNKMRQEAADRYFDLLGEAQGIELPESSSENQHVWHIYAVRVQHREAVLTALHKAGVGAGIHYPIPIHLLGAFEFLEHKEGDFPKAESAASEMISLPMFPGISEAQQVEVSRALVAAVKDSQDS
jgi:dTDP-4-amino-4,6-dideoxygalactose transaminase